MPAPHVQGHPAPDMAPAMLRRFVGSAIPTAPIVLYSPLGASLVGQAVALPFGLSHGLLGFALTSIVVWWGGGPFVSSPWRALRQGGPTLMAPIPAGIFVGYGHSGAVPLRPPGGAFFHPRPRPPPVRPPGAPA